MSGVIRRVKDAASSAIRKEAASGARDAVMPWVMVAVGLSLLALSRTSRRSRR